MTFTVPNRTASGDSTEKQLQAQPDAADFLALGLATAGTGVASGCAVAQRAAGANMSVDVASGVVASGRAMMSVATTNVAIATADATNPRFDLVRVSSAGVVSALAGTPADPTAIPGPVFPTLSAGDVWLAAVYVGAGVTSIVSADIVDKRAMLDAGDLLTTATYLRNFR